MGIKSFLFPKNFSQEMQKGQIGGQSTIKLGMERVKKRSEKWYNFFAWLPIVGNIVFYIEGRRKGS